MIRKVNMLMYYHNLFWQTQEKLLPNRKLQEKLTLSGWWSKTYRLWPIEQVSIGYMTNRLISFCGLQIRKRSQKVKSSYFLTHKVQHLVFPTRRSKSNNRNKVRNNRAQERSSKCNRGRNNQGNGRHGGNLQNEINRDNRSKCKWIT